MILQVLYNLDAYHSFILELKYLEDEIEIKYENNKQIDNIETSEAFEYCIVVHYRIGGVYRMGPVKTHDEKHVRISKYMHQKIPEENGNITSKFYIFKLIFQENLKASFSSAFFLTKATIYFYEFHNFM